MLWSSRLSPCLRCRHPLWAMAGVLAAPLLCQLTGNASWKDSQDGCSAWVPDNHVGDLDGVPASWLQPNGRLCVCVYTLRTDYKK